MLIDWFTVIAQIINFLILMWLLKRFLYKPILQAVDARDKKIKAQLQEAEQKMQQATTERKTYEQKNAEFDQQRQAMLKTATDEVMGKRKALLEEARKAASALQAKLEQTVRDQEQALSAGIVRRTRQEVMAITRKVLEDLASADLEERIADLFITHIQALSDEDKSQLIPAVESAGFVTVRSAFELPDHSRKAISDAVEQVMPKQFPIRFEQEEEQIAGIELSAGGYKLAWSIGDYLNALQNAMSAMLKDTTDHQTPTKIPTTDEQSTA